MIHTYRYIRCALVTLTSFVLLLAMNAPVLADFLLVRGGTLIDMAGNPPLSDARILIEDFTIMGIWSGDGAGMEIPEQTRIVDATGKFIIPGLIDSHIHYNWYMGELYLAHGVTLVNDLGSRIYWQTAVRKGLNSGKLRGPRFMFCSRIAGAAPADYVASASQSSFAFITSPGEARDAVAVIRKNANCIRVGMNTPEANFQAITRAADAAGLSVIAHSYDALKSAAMGVDGIEHLEGVALSTIRSAEGLKAVKEMTLEEGHKHPLLYQWMEPEHYDEVIDALIKNNVYLNPTLIHEWKGSIDRTPEFEQDDLRLFNNIALQYMPMNEKLVILGEYHWADPARAARDGDSEMFVNNSYFIRTRGAMQQLNDGYRKVQEFLRRFVAAGGKLYSGTDAAASNTPGLSLHHEMQLLVDAGLTPEQALASSTRWAAEALRVDQHLGTVEPGKGADIVILGADPLADIANTRKIEQVILGGRIVDTTYHADYEFPFHQYGPVSKHLYHQPPVIRGLNPAFATQGSITSLRIIGAEFMPESVVVFNGVPVTTRYLGPTELSAVLGQRETALPGSHLIGVQTPAPGGGDATPMEFIVDYAEER